METESPFESLRQQYQFENPPAQAEALTASAEPIIETSTADFIKPALAFASNTLAPNWAVADAEIEQLANAYGALLDKYYPDKIGFFDKWGAEITAITVTALVIAPRINTPLQPPEEPEKDNKKEGGSDE